MSLQPLVDALESIRGEASRSPLRQFLVVGLAPLTVDDLTTPEPTAVQALTVYQPGAVGERVYGLKMGNRILVLGKCGGTEPEPTGGSSGTLQLSTLTALSSSGVALPMIVARPLPAGFTFSPANGGGIVVSIPGWYRVGVSIRGTSSGSSPVVRADVRCWRAGDATSVATVRFYKSNAEDAAGFAQDEAELLAGDILTVRGVGSSSVSATTGTALFVQQL